MTIDHTYSFGTPVRSEDGQAVSLVSVSVAVRVQAESEVAARIISAEIERMFRKSIYAEAE